MIEEREYDKDLLGEACVYDDIYRHKDKSWKTSCKVRKQWQKHIGKHLICGLRW